MKIVFQAAQFVCFCTASQTDYIYILSRVTASGYIFWLTFRSLSDVLYSDECRTKKGFSMSK